MNRTALIRFQTEPSIFQALDDPTIDERGLVEATALQLRPREVDAGYLSCWQERCSEERERICAAWAANKRKADGLPFVRLPQSLLEYLAVEIVQQDDPDSPSCVASLHHGIFLADAEVRKMVAKNLLEELKKGNITRNQLYMRISKSNVTKLISTVHQQCQEERADIDEGKMKPWALELVKKNRDK
jgi:hypothetical protein